MISLKDSNSFSCREHEKELIVAQKGDFLKRYATMSFKVRLYTMYHKIYLISTIFLILYIPITNDFAYNKKRVTIPWLLPYVYI